MVIDAALRDMINNGRPQHEIKEYAVNHGMETLGNIARKKVLEGIISVEEMLISTMFSNIRPEAVKFGYFDINNLLLDGVMSSASDIHMSRSRARTEDKRVLVNGRTPVCDWRTWKM